MTATFCQKNGIMTRFELVSPNAKLHHSLWGNGPKVRSAWIGSTEQSAEFFLQERSPTVDCGHEAILAFVVGHL